MKRFPIERRGGNHEVYDAFLQVESAKDRYPVQSYGAPRNVGGGVTRARFGDLIVADTSTADAVILLPEIVRPGLGSPITVYNAGTGLCTVIPFKGQTILQGSALSIVSGAPAYALAVATAKDWLYIGDGAGSTDFLKVIDFQNEGASSTSVSSGSSSTLETVTVTIGKTSDILIMAYVGYAKFNGTSTNDYGTIHWQIDGVDQSTNAALYIKPQTAFNTTRHNKSFTGMATGLSPGSVDVAMVGFAGGASMDFVTKDMWVLVLGT